MKNSPFFVVLLGLLVICTSSTECKVAEELKLTLPHGGVIAGKYMTSHSGRGIRAFLGVPYAEPPTGQLRFQPPFPKFSWPGVWDATEGNRMCLQTFGATGEIIGDEDCLYVNVYAPLVSERVNFLFLE